MIKSCEICSFDFESGKHKGTKTCSKECLVIFREKTKEDRLRKSKEAILKKYGVDHVSKIKGLHSMLKKINY